MLDLMEAQYSRSAGVEAGVGALAGDARGGGVGEAVSAVRDLANELETRHAVQELSEGRRDGMQQVLALVDGLRRLANAVKAGATDVPRSSSGRRTSPRRVSSDAPNRRGGTVGSSAGAGSRKSKYVRTPIDLIKIGQVGTRKEYRHHVPLAAVGTVADWMAGRVAAGEGDLTFDLATEELGPRLKGYQIRAVIGWLRDHNLLEVPSRGRYVAGPQIASQAALLLESVPLERKRSSKQRRTVSAASGRRRGSKGR